MLEKKSAEADQVEIQNILKKINNLDKGFFLHYSKEIRQNRAVLRKRYPYSITSRHVVPDITSESNSCAFCLGYDVCEAIYPEAKVSESIYRHQPFFKVVIHLSQFDLHILLTFMLKWYQSIGLTRDLSKWMFVLLICLEEPVTIYTEEFLISLRQKFNEDKNSKSGEELVRITYLLKCINSIFNLERQKTIRKLWQYEKISAKRLFY